MFGSLTLAVGRVISSALAGPLRAVHLELRLLDKSVDGTTAEPLWGPFGLYGRPREPVAPAEATDANPEGHAEVVAIRYGDQVLPLVFRDLRLNRWVNPVEGEIGLVQYGGGFLSLRDNADGNGTEIALYAPRHNADGAPEAAHLFSMDSAADNASVQLVHAKGQSLALTKEGNVVLANSGGDAWLQVGDDGITLSAGAIAVTGGAMLGDKDPAAGDAVMLATELLAWVSQVNVALGEISTIITGLTGSPVTNLPGAQPAGATKVRAK